MDMNKWTETKKKVEAMPIDDFLLLADLVTERLKKVKKENIEHTLEEINLTLQKLNQDYKIFDKDGYDLTFPYLDFLYDEDDNSITIETN